MFNTNKSRVDGAQTYCKKCDNAYHRSWYSKPGNSAKSLAYSRQRKRRARLWFNEIKSNYPVVNAEKATQPLLISITAIHPKRISVLQRWSVLGGAQG